MNDETLPLRSEATTVPKRLVHQPKWLVMLGFVLIALGATAMIAPPLTPPSTAPLMGWLLLLSGAVHGGSMFSMARLWRIAGSAMLAIISVVVGLLVLFNPQPGMRSLALILGAYFLATGATKIFSAIQDEQTSPRSWGITSGIVSLLLAVMVLWRATDVTAWALGLLFGVNLALTGVALIALYFAIRS